MRRAFRIGVRMGIVTLAVWTGVQGASAADRRDGGAPVIVTPLDNPAPPPVSQNLLDMQQQLDELRHQFERLENQVEIQSHQIEVLSTQQQRQGADLDRRLHVLETAPKAAPAPPPAPASQTPGPTAAEQQDYDAAFNLMRQGRFPDAIVAFRAFLSAHPNSNLADNAQYWIAQADYVMGNYAPALQEFQRVLTAYPNSAKAPDSLLKVGYLYYDMNRPEQARKTLQDVIKRYPNTESAKAAQDRLRKMGKAKKSKKNGR